MGGNFIDPSQHLVRREVSRYGIEVAAPEPLTRYGRSANCSCCMRPDAYWQICWLMRVLESLRRPAAEGDMHRRY